MYSGMFLVGKDVESGTCVPSSSPGHRIEYIVHHKPAALGCTALLRGNHY